MLHRRIRELEETCIKAGVAVPAFGGERIGEDLSMSDNGQTSDSPELVNQSLLSTSLDGQAQQSPMGQAAMPHPMNNRTPANCSPRTQTGVYPNTPFELDSNVTGMGAIRSVDEDGRPANEYFGSSSTVSLMRLVAGDVGTRRSAHAHGTFRETPTRLGRREQLSSLAHGVSAPPSQFQVEEFLLPPRDLADHLLDCFWDRVYCLYPFFDRKSFQDAYDNLWISRNQPAKPLSDLDIGLGNKNHSDPRSIVFICALNMIFALGCHFADIPVHEREGVAHTFFLRGKKFVGLDMLNIRTVGTVQAFLVSVLFLQSTPYPHRCWQAIGVACRLAQGLGLHEAQPDECQHPLEREIQRRTWHGCVMMDTFVSMTYGRPTMTSHLSNVHLPECSGPGLGDEHSPSIMAFYLASIKLYRILDSILSDVYRAWRSRASMTPVGTKTRHGSHGGIDAIIELEEKLFQYESNLPSFLSWTTPSTPAVDPQHQVLLKRQRNVLHASTIYGATLTKCAAACAKAAINLISLVHNTYQGSLTDSVWYNGYYTSTAGMVIIMSYACRPISEEVEKATIDATWTKCAEILEQMGSFSLSARNTLQFLQAARAQVLTSPQEPPSAAECNTATPGRQHDSSQSNQEHLTAIVPPTQEASNAFNWDMTMGPLASELGFLGPFDLNELHGWLPEWELGMADRGVIDGYDWDSRIEPVTELNVFTSPPNPCFAEDEALKGRYDAPEEFGPIARGKDINGSFFSDYTIEDDDTPTYHVSWATYKAKLVESEQDYKWVQTTVLVKWKIPSQIEVFFLNLEDKQKRYIVARLPREENKQFHPFTWHALLAGSIIGLYNKCFWDLRDLKREVTSQPSRDLARQHDIARHIFHLCEVLEVAENTLKNLVSEYRRFREEFPDLTEGKRGVIINTQQKLLFVEREMHSHRMRARSLTERLNNELNLGFNLAAFSESAVMKTIGFVTMLYLPGTFVSVEWLLVCF
ncbi:fungal-specific transcription factor domain-containing protein [Aspergillus floccosus]